MAETSRASIRFRDKVLNGTPEQQGTKDFKAPKIPKDVYIRAKRLIEGLPNGTSLDEKPEYFAAAYIIKNSPQGADNLERAFRVFSAFVNR